MLPGQISTNNLPTDIGSFAIDMYSLPGITPVSVGKGTRQDLGVQISFALEITVKRATRQTSARHNLVDRDVIEAELIE